MCDNTTNNMCSSFCKDTRKLIFCIFVPILERLIMIDQIIAFNKTFVAQKGYKTHPLVPKDIVVRGFIIDSETGAFKEI